MVGRLYGYLTLGLIGSGLLSGCTENPRSARLTEASADEPISYDSLTHRACAYLQLQQARCDSAYHLSEYDNWYYDEATGQLTFSDPTLPKLVIDYEYVGSVSLKSNTWLWAWDNSHSYEKVRSEIGQVRAFGLRRGESFMKLTEPLWTADECDGWDMTAIAAYLMKAKGAYRVPLNDNTLYSFMIFKSVRIHDKYIGEPR
ncbi:DUF6882 domain-containing protein [Hymenobacter sp. B81]|uniref:DUF6882 domain-containing protein n=1 Tax=Hymenobacter sp. B81 TaxID=3344878 RepID=UPI0037DC78DD